MTRTPTGNLTTTLNLSLLVALTLILSGANRAGATLIAYDGFEAGGAAPGASQYATGTGFAGVPNNDQLRLQGPALTGFNSGDVWTSSAGYAATVYYKTEAGGLNYGDLITTPGQVRYFRSGGASAENKVITRDATTTDVGQTQWISFLLNADSNFADNGDDFRVEMRWDIVDGTNLAGGRPLTLSLDGDGNVAVEPAVDVTGNASIGDSGSGLSTDQTHMFLWKISGDMFTDSDFSNGRLYDEFTLYIDPDLSQGEAGLAGSSAQVLSGRGIFRDNVFGALDDTRAPFGNLDLEGTLISPSNITFDEFRIGTSFVDVAPTPEPGTALLAVLGLGALGTGLRRRRA